MLQQDWPCLVIGCIHWQKFWCWTNFFIGGNQFYSIFFNNHFSSIELSSSVGMLCSCGTIRFNRRGSFATSLKQEISPGEISFVQSGNWTIFRWRETGRKAVSIVYIYNRFLKLKNKFFNVSRIVPYERLMYTKSIQNCTSAQQKGLCIWMKLLKYSWVWSEHIYNIGHCDKIK